MNDLVLNVIGNFKLDGQDIRQGRAFILGDRIVVFKRNGSKTELAATATVVEFERSDKPRRVAHVVKTSEGKTWTLLEFGCGCGSPIKKLRISDARAALEGVTA